jgi:hypothetical protein
MVTFLITSILLLGLFAISIYFWQKPSKSVGTAELPPPDQPRGLFDHGGSDTPAQLPTITETDISGKKEALIERANQGDKNVLQEAYHLRDNELYIEVLSVLVDKAQSAPQLLSLVSYVTQHELPVSEKLAVSFIESSKQALNRASTAKMLHIAALSDNAETLKSAVDVALHSWREGNLSDVTAIELQALFNGEFWVLSSRTRSSGAGFLLKRTIASARRELDAAPNN